MHDSITWILFVYLSCCYRAIYWCGKSVSDLNKVSENPLKQGKKSKRLQYITNLVSQKMN